MSKEKDNPGNTIAAQRAFDQEMVGRGVLLGRADRYVDSYAEDDVFINGFTVRIPQDEGQDVLIVMRAVADGKAVVAYHGATTIHEAILGIVRRMQNKSLRWKDDQYA